MKKILALALTLMMVLSLAACGEKSTPATSSAPAASSTASGDKQIIKISFGLSAASAEATGAAKFEELIEEKYPDEFDVQIYSDAQLGDDTAATQDVAMGNLECVITSCSPLVGLCADLQVFDLPFMFPNNEAADAVLASEVADDIAAQLQQKGLRNLGWFENGFRQLTNSKHEVHTPADLDGLKIRTMENPMHLDAWKALGAAPTPLAFSEVFTALEQGAIDGQENPISTIYLNKFHEVNAYCSLTNHIYSPKCFLMSEQLFQSLTAEQQEYFLLAGQEAAEVNKETNRKQCEDFISNLTEEGMTITELTADEQQAFVDATAPLYEQYADTIGSDLIASVQEICAEYR